MSTTVTYKGNVIATVDNDTKTLLTAGYYCEDNFTLTDSSSGGGAPKPFVIRPDAELVQSWSADDLLVEDLEIALPAYSTTAKTLITGANLTPTISLDYANYNYFVELRTLTIPIYSTATIVKGRCEYTMNSYHYEMTEIPANEIVTVNGAKVLTSRSAAMTAMGSTGRTLYWSSTSAIAAASNTTYGPNLSAQAPSVSSGVCTVKEPNYGIRGSTTYFTSGAWSSMTDIRYQWVIEVWRAPKGNVTDGWQHNSNIRHVAACVRTNGGTLT